MIPKSRTLSSTGTGTVPVGISYILYSTVYQYSTERSKEFWLTPPVSVDRLAQTASTRRPATRAAAGVVRAGHGLGVWCGFSPNQVPRCGWVTGRRLDAASQGPCTTVRLVWEDGQRGQQCDPVRRSHSEDRRGRGRGGDVDSAGAFRERARPSFPCPAVRCAAHWTAALAPAATRLDLGGCAKDTKEAAGVPTSQPHGQSVV